ncbi:MULTISPECIES: restriction endonuclease subunit S [Bacteroidales]|uniref:restriction endonuclease subunit S n=1 Tax=Bacteroidales TaxID=171549 RepID=UPI00202FDD69|nr:restriction endonuclease subunit S [Parabacteroides sp. B2-Q-110]MCM0670859.1 restriction endonuclease subunit S [Parabacteroides sp. B2-Q-110]
MAIDNKDKKILNVPHLRFPEFSGEWKKVNVSKLLDFYSTNSLSWEQLDYNNGKIKNLHYGLIHKGLSTMIDVFSASLPYIKEGTIPKSYTLFKEGDVAFADASEDTNDVAKAIEVINCDGQQIVSGLHTIHGRDNSNQTVIGYKGYAFASDSFHKQIRRIAQGTKVFSISIRNFDEVYIGVPSKDEQTKIAKLLIAIDERIATQNKIIEKLQSLIKGIAQHCIKESTSGNTYVKLGDICQITTGKLDANAQVDNGIYPFFTCAEQPFKIDSFAFDTEALLISGNGANLGYINYYKGKFNAYQRTYVLDLFSENIQYIKWALKVLLPKRIAIEKSSSNTPYIVLSTLTDLRLPIPCKSKQSFIANLMQSLERKLSNQIAQYDSYNYLKQYLLRQMFI